MDVGDVSPNLAALAERWWVLVVRGVVAILFGILCFIAPGISLMAMIFLWGIYALVDGVVNLLIAFQRAQAGWSWGGLILEAILSLAAGVITFVWPGVTALVLLVVIGVWAIATGIAELAAAFRLRRLLHGEWLLGLCGVLSIALGIILLVSPGAGALAFAWLIGVYALLFGVLLIALGVRLHQWSRAGEPMIPTGGAPTPV